MTTFVPTPPIATLCKVANMLPPLTSGIVDCHHDAKLVCETPAGQNPAVHNAAGVIAYARPAPPNAPPERMTAAHLEEIYNDSSSASSADSAWPWQKQNNNDTMPIAMVTV